MDTDSNTSNSRLNTGNSSDKENSRKKSLIQIASVFIVSLLLAFIICEGFIRLYFNGKVTTINWKDDPNLGRRLVPNQNGLFVSNTFEYKTKIEVNSEGFRDSDHTRDKSIDSYRILFLGDSFVENFQVPLEGTFFKQIENKLEYKDKKIETIALGLGDSGSAQQYILYNKYGKNYKPDIVVHFFYVGNDIKNNSLDLQQDPFRPYIEIKNDTLNTIPFSLRSEKFPYSLLIQLKNFSQFAKFLLDTKGKIIQKINTAKNFPIEYQVYNKSFSPLYTNSWNLTQKLLLETKKEVEKAGSKYTIFIVPTAEQVYPELQKIILDQYKLTIKDDIDFDKPTQILKQFCQENKISCIFGIDGYKKYLLDNTDSKLYYVYDGHWTEEGTRVTAEIIIDYFQEFLDIK